MPALGEQGDSALEWTADLPDRYEIVREHGRGGMATVYLATDRKHDRPVALKVLAPELAAGIGAERFLREIQIAAHLNHPHIVPLLDSGLAGGRPFYVMPFVEGESLRERLARQERLSLAEAARVAHDVAEALVYAHQQGVVHRDIKPGNVLLTADSAVVTDFGIALAVDEAAQPHLTRTGLSVGTAGYMSPEQASGDDELDARTDQYSLAAVLFEMLAGVPPYTGRNARAVLGKQLTDPVPEITEFRDSVPAELSGLLQRALAKDPNDRYPTTRSFAEALEMVGHRAAVSVHPARIRRRPVLWAALVAVAVLGAAWTLSEVRVQRTDPPLAEPASADPFTYAVFPFISSLSDTIAVGEDLLLRDALARWDGIHVIQAFQLRDRMERAGADNLGLREAAEIAFELGAGRFLTGRLDRRGDGIRVEADLYEATRSGAIPIETAKAMLESSLQNADSAFADLADYLLFRGEPPASSRPEVGRRSYPAHLAYQAGYRALEVWDLAKADSAFLLATQMDAQFAKAYLWTALVRAWTGADPSLWRPFAEQAQLRSGALSEDEATMSEAIAAQADGRLGEACELWRGLTRAHDGDFVAWYGLAACLHTDDLVVVDRASPSRWSFRSSHHESLTAYRRAFDRLPSILESFGSDSDRSLRRLLLVSSHKLRAGRSDTGPDLFLAYPAWRGDTLAYLPWPMEEAFTERAQPTAHELAEAVRQQRRVFLEVSRSWAAVAERSANAREVMAIGLLMNGYRTALDTLLSARRLASASGQLRSIASNEVWIRLLLSFPDDPEGLRRVRFLADSLLATTPIDDDPRETAALAVLLGRGTDAASHARTIPVDESSALSPVVQSSARALEVFATLGGPRDSLVRLERDVVEGLDRVLPVANRPLERDQWLTVPAALAFSSYAFPSARSMSDPLVAAQRMVADGDSSQALKILLKHEEDREGILPHLLTLDALVSEASLFVALDRHERAIRVMEPTQSELPLIDLDVIKRPEQAGSLLRLAGLRADAAFALGDGSEARRWALPVVTMWAGADSFLREQVERMRRYARCDPCE